MYTAKKLPLGCAQADKRVISEYERKTFPIKKKKKKIQTAE